MIKFAPDDFTIEWNHTTHQFGRDFFDQNSPHTILTSIKTYHLTQSSIYSHYSNVRMITFKNKYDGSLVMSQQTHAQEVTSHSPVARLVTIGHFESEQSLVVVAQWEEHALSVSPSSIIPFSFAW